MSERTVSGRTIPTRFERGTSKEGETSGLNQEVEEECVSRGCTRAIRRDPDADIADLRNYDFWERRRPVMIPLGLNHGTPLVSGAGFELGFGKYTFCDFHPGLAEELDFTVFFGLTLEFYQAEELP